MIERTIWTVTTNTDLTEGRGREYVRHFCKLESTAVRLAKKGYVQGTDCPISQFTAIEEGGKITIPSWFIHIVDSTREDEDREQLLTKVREAVGKAKGAGLSDEEIALIAGRCL